MSDGLTPPGFGPAFGAHPPTLVQRRDWRVLVRVAAMVAAYAVAAVGAGFAWRHLWTPPEGVVFGGQWFPDPTEEAFPALFGATGWYVVLSLAVGLVLGAVTAFVFDRIEVIGLVVVVLGGVLAAYLILTVGLALSPPDPAVVAATAADGTRVPGELSLDLRGPDDADLLGTGWTVLLSAPLGAVAGATFAFLGSGGRR